MCQRRKESKAKRYIRLCRGNLNLGCRILLPKPFILYCQNQTLIYQSSAETKRTEKTLRTDQCTIASGKIQSIWAEPVSSDVYDQKIWMTYLEEVHTHTHTHSSLKQCEMRVHLNPMDHSVLLILLICQPVAAERQKHELRNQRGLSESKGWTRKRTGEEAEQGNSKGKAEQTCVHFSAQRCC